MTTEELLRAIVAALVSGSMVAAVLGLTFQRWVTRSQQEIKLRFDQLAEVASSQRQWKERSLCELLGPVFMQLDRTEKAFRRWDSQNLYLEAKVVRVGNETIRNLLLDKGHLIPPDLLDAAGLLVEHYDRWLEEFDKLRGSSEPNLGERFVFVGIGERAIPFPSEAARRFQQRFREAWDELYGSGGS